MGDKTSLGDRMKQQYENRTRFMLPRRSFTIIRIDGKAFHTATIGCEKPFDERLMQAMDRTAKFLVQEIQGAQFAYIQSDEISVLLTDFAQPNTEAWFNGNVQKMASVAASLATGEFNLRKPPYMPTCFFDARVFQIPDPVEVQNYFVWRQKDWIRNSVSMLARKYYSHKELDGVNVSGMHELLHKKNVNWAHKTCAVKNGRCIVNGVISSAPIFTQQVEWLARQIPRHWEEE